MAGGGSVDLLEGFFGDGNGRVTEEEGSRGAARALDGGGGFGLCFALEGFTVVEDWVRDLVGGEIEEEDDDDDDDEEEDE